MTNHIDLPAILTCSPKYVATQIVKAQIKKKNIVYIKWLWKYIMAIVKLIPENLFNRLSL